MPVPGSRARALVWTKLFVGARAKIWAPCPGTGTASKGSTRAPFLGTGTGLNRILSVPTFFPHASLRYSKQNGGRLIDEGEHDYSLGTKESEQRPFSCPWHGHLVWTGPKNITHAESQLRTFLFQPNVFKMNSINTDKIIHEKIQSILSN